MTTNARDNFISPVTGRILCTVGKWLQGNDDGIAMPVSVYPIGGLPDLTINKQWVGDETNRPVELPYLGAVTFIVRLPTSLIPNSQALQPLGLGLLKLLPDGSPSLAIPLLDYATVAYEDTLIVVALEALSAAAIQSVAAAIYQDSARVSAEGAAAQAVLAHTAAIDTHNYYVLLLGITLDQLPNFGDVNINFYRLKNIAQSPVQDMDAVSFRFLTDLMNDEVDIIV